MTTNANKILTFLGSCPRRAMPLSVIVARTGLSQREATSTLRSLRKSEEVRFRGAHGTYAASWGIVR